MKKYVNGKEVKDFNEVSDFDSFTVEITGDWLGNEDSCFEPEKCHTVGISGVSLDELSEAIESFSDEFETIEKIEILL